MRYRLFRDRESLSDIPWIVMFPEFFLRIWNTGRMDAQAYEDRDDYTDWLTRDTVGGYTLVDKR